jgi:hypothetical protein
MQIIEAVQNWARDHGAKRLYGPVNFTTALPYRFRLSGPPDAYLDEPYNPPGYAERFEAVGFELVRSYASHDMDPEDVKALADNTAKARADVAEQGFRIESLTPERWLERSGEMLAVGNEVFASNFAFKPMSRAEFDAHFGEAWARRLHPELSLIAYDPDDRVAGVCFTYPHYAPLVAQGAGDARVPVGELNFAEHGAANTEIVYKTAGVSSKHRRRGLAWALTGEMAIRAGNAGVTMLYMGAIREDNPSLVAVRHGWRRQRVYGLYARDLM